MSRSESPVGLPLLGSFMGLGQLLWACLVLWPAAQRTSVASPAPARRLPLCLRTQRISGGLATLLTVMMLPLLEHVPRMSGPSLGSETLFSAFSAGSSASSTWHRSWAAHNDRFLQRPRHGDARKVSSPRTMRCSKPWPAWTASMQSSYRMTTTGSAISCNGPLRAMTGSGPGLRAANSPPTKLSCATASNGTWLLHCKSGSSNPWRPPCPRSWPICPTSCSTRTPFELCFRVYHRPQYCSCSSGTMSTSYKADYTQGKQLRDPPMSQDCLSEAIMLLSLGYLRGTTPPSFSTRPDRPGPKSGDEQALHVISTFSFESLFVDTRVGRNSGRRLPETMSLLFLTSSRGVKLYDPSFSGVHSQTICTPSIGSIPNYKVTHRVACFTENGQSQFPNICLPLSLFTQGSYRKARKEDDASGSGSRCLIAIGVLISVAQAVRLLSPEIEPRPRCTHRMFPGCYRRREGALTVPCPRQLQAAGREDITLCTRVPPSLGQTGSTLRVPRLLLRILVGLAILDLARAYPGKSPSPAQQQAPNVLRVYGRTARVQSFSQKRAFRRAQARALRDGFTYYRGQPHTPASLSLASVESQSPRRSLQAPLPQSALRCVTWNAGGLHSSRYAELLNWLESQTQDPIHICCVQETHWPASAEYSNHRWLFVHTGTNSSQGGVLLVISKSCANADTLKFCERIPGRVLQAKLLTDPPLELLGVYQYAWTPNSKSRTGTVTQRVDQLLQQRAGIWSSIASWVAGVPKRNGLLLLGDLNTTLKPCPPHIGLGVATQTSCNHADQEVLQRLMISHNLVALNTWGRKGWPAGTFLHHAQHTVQLDFLITKLPAQPFSLKACALKHSCLVHPNGLRHVPVSGLLPLPAIPRSRPATHGPLPREIRKQMQQDPEFQSRFRVEVQKLLAGTTPAATMDTEDVLARAWQKCTSGSHKGGRRSDPCPPTASAAVPHAELLPSLKLFWSSKQRFRQTLASTDSWHAPVVWHVCDAPSRVVIAAFPRALRKLGAWFACWRQSARFGQLDRTLKKHARLRKRAQVDMLIGEAQRAEAKGLTSLFQLTRTLCPKSSKRSIHFRDDAGRLLTAAEELNSLKTYFEDLYQSTSPAYRPSPVLQQALHITQAEVRNALQHLSAKKALPRGHPPALLWKLSAEALIPHLCNLFNQALAKGRISFPASWHRSYLTLIPKHGKPPNSPGNLRPLSLLPLMPQLLAKIAAERLKPLLHDAMKHIPQFSYLAHRNSADAIDRVVTHCHQVRDSLRLHSQRTVFTTYAGRKQCGLIGGVQLSLDVSRAFDKLPRHRLAEALQRVCAPPELITLILFIHDNTKLVLCRHHLSQEISMLRGIRQGCGLQSCQRSR